jgi:carboxypeptidase T
MPIRRVAVTAALALFALAAPLTATAAVSAVQPPPSPPPGESNYRVQGVDTAAERSEVARQGVDVLGAGRDYLEVRATPQQADRMRASGLQLLDLPALPGLPGVPGLPGLAGSGDFPPGYSGYHTYAELGEELNSVAAQHPDLVAVSQYGTSPEGRALPLVKISDNAHVDQNKPEVLFTCGQHAREHLTVEMCLHIVKRLADGYNTDPAITQLVHNREVWVLPMTNPDGAEYDISKGSFAYWRKNRQPTPGSTEVGTDLNRNWGTQWGCCGGSSGEPADETYRGPAPFSAPEIAQLRDFVNSRVVGGTQQITAHIDFHTFSELVLWPYGYTTSDTGPGLDAADAKVFSALGKAMAATNGYTPEQASDLYITDGGVNDWMWAQHHIWSYTFEMYPTSELQGGFYPPDTDIKRETERNDKAVDLLLGYADCVPRIVGGSCG